MRKYISLKELIESQRKSEKQVENFNAAFEDAGTINTRVYEKRNFSKEFQVIEFDKTAILFVNISSCILKYAESFSLVFSNLIQSGKKRIIVDLSEVCIIDSTFIGILVKAFRTTLISGGMVKLVVNQNGLSKNTLLTKSLDRVFYYFPDIRSCLESFEKPGSWGSLNTFIPNREIIISNN